jgi:glucuronoarabinoxylan endo-1,4-beta-xylanase
MKVNESLGCGSKAGPPCNETTCRLKDGMEPELAGYFVRFVRLLKDSAGIDLYALGVQNEPAFSAPFPMCVTCPARFRDIVKATAARFRDEGIATRFFGCEHMSHSFGMYEGAIRADEQAMSDMYAWAVHAYGDGISPDTSWYARLATDKDLWQTETGGKNFGETLYDWPKALVLARSMMGYLRHTQATVWLFWRLMRTTTSDIYTFNVDECLMVNGRPTDKYYIVSHFARYVRPGATQVLSTSSDNAVQVFASYHDENDCLSIVLINAGEATTVSLDGADLPATFERVASTADAKLQRSTVASNEPISLPDSSIVTLVAGTYRSAGTSGVEPRAPASFRVQGTTLPANVARTEILTLDGRRVGVFGTRSTGAALRRLPAGIYVRACIDPNGRLLSSNRLTVNGR